MQGSSVASAASRNSGANISGPVSRSEGFYRPELDCLRFVAFLGVYIVHTVPIEPKNYTGHGVPRWIARLICDGIQAGVFGVDLFFVLSAYLITELLVREKKSAGSIHVWAFYARRALRIWPLYFGFIAFSVFGAGYFLPGNTLAWPYLPCFLAFVGNWACALWGWNHSVATPLWSVSVEEQFYLTWPFLLRTLGSRALRLVLFALILVAIGGRVLQYLGIWGGALGNAGETNTVARLDSFALGTGLALALNGDVPNFCRAKRVLVASVAFLLVLLAAVLLRSERGYVLAYLVAGLSGCLLLAALLGADVAAYTFIKPFVFLGRISYGLYVFHMFSILFVKRLVLALKVPFFSYIPLGLVLTVLLAAVSYYSLERPFLRLKSRFTYVASRPA
jgi:peptidoglycan/LPS O-acetylase OafA/YrhL